MLKNYLVVALRSIRRHPGYSLVNVVGLAVGIAACLLILLYVQHELSYDRMHDDAGRLYRVVESRAGADGSAQEYVYTAGPLGPELARTLPDVTASARGISRWMVGRSVVERGDVRFYVGDHVFVEPEFFELFDFEVVKGSLSGALDEPLEAILSEEAAVRYFGTDDPIGKTVSVEGPGDFTVRAVVRLPSNSHVDYSFFFSFATLLNIPEWRTWLEESWSSSGVITYVRLAPGARAAAVTAAMQRLVRERSDAEAAEARTPYLQAVTDVHLGSTHIDFDEHATPGRRVYLYLFGIVAVLVVLIAAMNYTNMATARSIRRAREIGMRKVVGARRIQLVGQFLAESLLTTAIAVAAAVMLARLALPVFNAIAGTDLTLSLSGPLVAAGAALVLAVGLAAGAYPALALSRFKPADVLQGGPPGRRAAVHKALVVAQFAFSIGLIIATLVVHEQLRYVQTTELGFDQHQLAVIDINSGDVRSRFAAVEDAFAAVPGVRSVTVSNRVPGEWKNLTQVDVGPYGASTADLIKSTFFGVDEHFLATYDIDLLEGRNFGVGFAADSSSVLLNQTAADRLNVQVGDRIEVPDDEYVARVVGIVDDFHFQSLHEQIGPLLVGYRSNPIDVIDYFTVRMDGANVSATLEGLQAVGQEFDPEHPFELNFLDQRLADFYEREEQVARIFGAAAMLAIFVACLGLFALAAYAAEQRTKEIGIRKALGATAGRIAGLLTAEFARLVALAFVIAAPVAYLAMSWWLREFAYRTAVGLDVIALAGGGALLLAVATVGYQAVRAAMADPVKALRYE